MLTASNTPKSNLFGKLFRRTHTTVRNARPLPDNRARLQPLHVEDLCGAVLALLERWPEQPCSLALVGPEAMTQGQLLDRLRAAQGWGSGRYGVLPQPLAVFGAALGERFGWRALNRQTLTLARRDNLAAPEPLAGACGYRCLPLEARLHDWPSPADSVRLALQPWLLALLVAIWLGTALACLGPGFDWGLSILAEAGITGWPARLAVTGGALCDALLGLGLLLPRWRRRALQAQIVLMLGYTALVTWLLPHYWFDPFQGVGKNLLLLPVSLWLLWLQPAHARSRHYRALFHAFAAYAPIEILVPVGRAADAEVVCARVCTGPTGAA